MIVVSDTSPIRALHHVGCLHYLGHLFDSILITPSVVGGVGATRRRRYVPVIVSAIPFVQVRAHADARKVESLLDRVDLAEAESLIMAVEAGVQTVLIDEASGRAEAVKLGQKCVGAVGVLIDLRKMGMIDSLAMTLHRLKVDLGVFSFRSTH